MQESWSLHYGTEVYPCLITYKRMRNIRFHFAKDGKTFCVSCPYGISRKSLQDSINKFFPKMLKKMAYEPPYTTDEVYLFGVKTSYPGFGALPEKERAKILKAKLLEFVTPKVREYESQMGVKKPYRVRVRSMESRYGVNSQRTHALTFTTALAHYAPETIISVVVHELAHDFVFNHSDSFYQIVYRFCPNYDLLHAKLRKHHYE
jgi:predicted metal-dependent hydrolase